MPFLAFYIYLFVPLVTLLSFLPIYKINNNKFPNIISIFIVFGLILIILITRDVLAPTDIGNYKYMYSKSDTFAQVFEIYHKNYFFSFLMYIGNIFNMPCELFFRLLSILYLYIFYIGLKLIFKEPKYYILALVLFSLSSTFVLLFTNVIRQGLALSLLILAIGLILNKKKLLSYIIIILAIFSHFGILPIVLFLWVAKYLSDVRIKLRYIILLLFLPILGTMLLNSFAQLGGLFNKIQSFAHKDYNNNLVYIKVIILYIFIFIFYFYGKKLGNFKIYAFRYIFNLYLLIISLVLFTLPVLLLSSRFLYFASGLMPILLSFIFYSNRNLVNIKIRYLLFVTGAIFYGLAIYNYKSITMQLGV